MGTERGRRMRRAVVLAACALAGCFSREMVHAETGQRMKCEAFGWGLIGLPVAAAMFDQCIQRAEARGYR